jgi:hypothetical protein
MRLFGSARGRYRAAVQSPYGTRGTRLGARVGALLLVVGIGCRSATDGAPSSPPASEQADDRPPAPPPPPVAPAVDAPLVDRFHHLAETFGSLTREDVEQALEVELSADGNSFRGTSRRWPMTVRYTPVPPAADRWASLYLSLNDTSSITLGDVEARFGPPVFRLKSKISWLSFDAPSGMRLKVQPRGGMGPSATVSSLELMTQPEKPPHLPDLFDDAH